MGVVHSCCHRQMAVSRIHLEKLGCHTPQAGKHGTQVGCPLTDLEEQDLDSQIEEQEQHQDLQELVAAAVVAPGCSNHNQLQELSVDLDLIDPSQCHIQQMLVEGDNQGMVVEACYIGVMDQGEGEVGSSYFLLFDPASDAYCASSAISGRKESGNPRLGENPTAANSYGWKEGMKTANPSKAHQQPRPKTDTSPIEEAEAPLGGRLSTRRQGQPASTPVTAASTSGIHQQKTSNLNRQLKRRTKENCDIQCEKAKPVLGCVNMVLNRGWVVECENLNVECVILSSKEDTTEPELNLDEQSRFPSFNTCCTTRDFVRAIKGFNARQKRIVDEIGMSVFLPNIRCQPLPRCMHQHPNSSVDIIDNSSVPTTKKEKYKEIPDDLIDMFATYLEKKKQPLRASIVSNFKPTRMRMP
nr:uncharacterized protein LOC109174778 [Ipomoea batatas]